MSWLGADLVAISCILGGAAVGGAATLALNQGGHHVDMGCGIEAMAVSPRIAISHGGDAHAIVVSPKVRVHSSGDCGAHTTEIVDIHMDRHLEKLDLQLEKLDAALEIQMEEFEQQLEAGIEQEMEAKIQLEQALQQLEEAQIQVSVRKHESGGI